VQPALKLVTHNAVGLGVAAMVSSLLGCSSGCVIASSLLGVIAQNIIDAFSHEHRGRYTRRTKLLHSVEGVTALTVILGGLVAGSLGFRAVDTIGLLVALEASVLSHLLLDSLTPGGVYVLGRKVVLARIPYDNPEVNMILQLLGFLALTIAILARI
jgi:membrane-bound metal-dependent hydrolase YbcI (DUF457 family)